RSVDVVTHAQIEGEPRVDSPVILEIEACVPLAIERIGGIILAAARRGTEQEAGGSISRLLTVQDGGIVDGLRVTAISREQQNIAAIVREILVAPQIEATLEGVLAMYFGDVGLEAVIIGDIQTAVPPQAAITGDVPTAEILGLR